MNLEFNSQLTIQTFVIPFFSPFLHPSEMCQIFLGRPVLSILYAAFAEAKSLSHET